MDGPTEEPTADATADAADTAEEPADGLRRSRMGSGRELASAHLRGVPTVRAEGRAPARDEGAGRTGPRSIRADGPRAAERTCTGTRHCACSGRRVSGLGADLARAASLAERRWTGRPRGR